MDGSPCYRIVKAGYSALPEGTTAEHEAQNATSRLQVASGGWRKAGRKRWEVEKMK
jgi:hypothetical protein